MHFQHQMSGNFWLLNAKGVTSENDEAYRCYGIRYRIQSIWALSYKTFLSVNYAFSYSAKASACHW